MLLFSLSLPTASKVQTDFKLHLHSRPIPSFCVYSTVSWMAEQRTSHTNLQTLWVTTSKHERLTSGRWLPRPPSPCRTQLKGTRWNGRSLLSSTREAVKKKKDSHGLQKHSKRGRQTNPVLFITLLSHLLRLWQPPCSLSSPPPSPEPCLMLPPGSALARE